MLLTRIELEEREVVWLAPYDMCVRASRGRAWP